MDLSFPPEDEQFRAEFRQWLARNLPADLPPDGAERRPEWLPRVQEWQRTLHRAGYVGLAVLAVLCSVVSAFFYLRVAVLMYMTEPQESESARLPVSVVAALAIAAAVTIVGGIFPNTLAVWAIPP